MFAADSEGMGKGAGGAGESETTSDRTRALAFTPERESKGVFILGSYLETPHGTFVMRKGVISLQAGNG